MNRAARARLRLGAVAGPNLTSMVDVVFILVVFFILVSQLTVDRLLKLRLPALEEGGGSALDSTPRLVINVVPQEQVAALGGTYRLGTQSYGSDEVGVRALATALRQGADRSPAPDILVRAARDEAFERVRPALRAASLAGLERVRLVLDAEAAAPASTDAPGPGATP